VPVWCDQVNVAGALWGTWRGSWLHHLAQHLGSNSMAGQRPLNTDLVCMCQRGCHVCAGSWPDVLRRWVQLQTQEHLASPAGEQQGCLHFAASEPP
jgi:hypothetical protein